MGNWAPIGQQALDLPKRVAGPPPDRIAPKLNQEQGPAIGRPLLEDVRYCPRKDGLPIVGMRADIQRRYHPRVADRCPKQVWMSRSQEEGAVSAHGEPRDAPVAVVGPGAVGGVHEGHHIMNDIGLIPTMGHTVAPACLLEQRAARVDWAPSPEPLG